MSVSKQKPKGLGRGLDVLLAAHHTEDRLATLKISDIRPGRYQPRTHMDEAALAQLADSILAQGVIQPVVVREIGLGEYELIAGERRWRAARTDADVFGIEDDELETAVQVFHVRGGRIRGQRGWVAGHIGDGPRPQPRDRRHDRASGSGPRWVQDDQVGATRQPIPGALQPRRVEPRLGHVQPSQVDRSPALGGARFSLIWPRQQPADD